MPEAIEINGRTYPLWSKFVHDKQRWVGGTLQEVAGDEPLGQGTISDITLEANGEASAYFSVHCTEGWSCAFDVRHGGVTAGDEGWITFLGYGGHLWRIKEATK